MAMMSLKNDRNKRDYDVTPTDQLLVTGLTPGRI